MAPLSYNICFAAVLFWTASLHAQTPGAAELAARLAALRQDGSSFVRLRMEIEQGGGKNVFQIQIKGRNTKTSSELVYQILWPKERKGESVLLRKTGDRPATGTLFTPSGALRSLDASDMKEPLFGSDLTYEDIIDNFFAWENQAVVGSETVDGVECQILESKPGKGERSSYGSVRTWVDTRRFVPLRVEKYSGSGQLLRRIDTTSVAPANGRPIPAEMTVRNRRSNSVTRLDGSRIRYDVTYTDRDFTPEGLKDLAPPPAKE